MGLRAAEDHAPTAYAASLLASQTLLKGLTGQDNQAEETGILSPILLEALTSAMGEEAKEEELVDVPQRKLGLKVDREQQRKREEMAEDGNSEEKARLKSLTLTHSGELAARGALHCPWATSSPSGVCNYGQVQIRLPIVPPRH